VESFISVDPVRRVEAIVYAHSMKAKQQLLHSSIGPAADGALMIRQALQGPGAR
jgi:hypothetical protein